MALLRVRVVVEDQGSEVTLAGESATVVRATGPNAADIHLSSGAMPLTSSWVPERVWCTTAPPNPTRHGLQEYPRYSMHLDTNLVDRGLVVSAYTSAWSAPCLRFVPER